MINVDIQDDWYSRSHQYDFKITGIVIHISIDVVLNINAK